MNHAPAWKNPPVLGAVRGKPSAQNPRRFPLPSFWAVIPENSEGFRFSRFPGFGNAFPEMQSAPQTRMVKPFSRFPGFPGFKREGGRKKMMEFMPPAP
jgi:hypothetical protein